MGELVCTNKSSLVRARLHGSRDRFERESDAGRREGGEEREERRGEERKKKKTLLIITQQQQKNE